MTITCVGRPALYLLSVKMARSVMDGGRGDEEVKRGDILATLPPAGGPGRPPEARLRACPAPTAGLGPRNQGHFLGAQSYAPEDRRSSSDDAKLSPPQLGFPDPDRKATSGGV